MKEVRFTQVLEYADCPNIAKYGQGKSIVTSQIFQSCKSVMLSCYLDAANLEKVVTWKTVRKRTTSLLEQYLDRFDNFQKYQQQVINTLSSVRTWYLSHFEHIESPVLANLEFDLVLSSLDIKVPINIDALIFHPEGVELVWIKEGRVTEEELLGQMELRAMLLALSQQSVEVKKVTCIGIDSNCSEIIEVDINTTERFLEQIEKTLVLIAGAIKHRVFYPTNSIRCKTCKFKSICRW